MRVADFTPGDDLTSCIIVNITDDSAYEGPHQFSAMIQGSTIGALAVGSPNMLTVEIFDREGNYAYLKCYYMLFQNNC